MTPQHVDLLQDWLKANNLNGLVIPSSDEFQNEYVPDSAKRLQWATEFSGSAGRAIVLQDRAVIFVDGRYTTQAKQQVNLDKFHVRDFSRDAIAKWLGEHVQTRARIGADPMLHTRTEIDLLRQQLKERDAELCELTENPVDLLWEGRPARPATPIELYPVKYAGLSSEDKRKQLCAQMKENRLSCYWVTGPEEVAWLLNIRARDIPVIPVSLSYALLDQAGKVVWFIDASLVTQEQRFELGPGVSIESPANVAEVLTSRAKGARVGVNISRTPFSFIKTIESVGEVVALNLIEQEKAKKNTTELEGARKAQQIDGRAMIHFLAWLDRTVATQQLTELDVAKKITEFRQEAPEFLGVSFRPISASGPNSAIAHYSATEATNRVVNEHPIFLIDSGGQYLGGTTDITRVVAVGKPTPEQKRAYTLVLKGHIGLARVRFPVGTSGSQVDVLARQHLWENGMDFSHGTGHGVGSYLSVHEGPASISPRPSPVPMCEGMILSNEPGYYLEGSFGIRIENLILVRKSTFDGYLEFETLTYVPMEDALIDFATLTEEEKRWLCDYHDESFRRFSSELSGEDSLWLKKRVSRFAL